jgi:carbonic anhydrase
MNTRLFEAMIEANHRALAGDEHAGLHPGDYDSELPLVALTCVDARLNGLLPQALGVPAEQFIWLRNAGNIITGPMSSTMRSLALACAVKGGKEICLIGHSDCQVGKTTTLQLIERFRNLGIERHLLPDNLNEFFGLFGSDRQNVMKAVEIVRRSPLIGPKIPVQGLFIEIETGRLEWLVNGYSALDGPGELQPAIAANALTIGEGLKSLAAFELGEMKFPETKIGELASHVRDVILDRAQQFTPAPAGATTPPGQAGAPTRPNNPIPSGPDLAERGEQTLASMAQELAERLARVHPPSPGIAAAALASPKAPPKIPMPPPMRPKMVLRRNPK